MLKEIFNYTLDEYESVVIVTTKNNATRVIIKTDEEKALNIESVEPVLSKESLPPERLEIFEELRLLRRDIAEKEKVRPYLVFSDKSLIDMCIKLPITHEAFKNVYGVGENKLRKYGDLFILKLNSILDCLEISKTKDEIDLDCADKQSN